MAAIRCIMHADQGLGCTSLDKSGSRDADMHLGGSADEKGPARGSEAHASSQTRQMGFLLTVAHCGLFTEKTC